VRQEEEAQAQEVKGKKNEQKIRKRFGLSLPPSEFIDNPTSALSAPGCSSL
jgi:hypothetical protein